jgi:hypothetical protein
MINKSDAEDDELIRKSNVVGIIYDPPQQGFPHLTTIFIHGELVVCEPVSSMNDGEALMNGILPDIPDLIKKARQKARRRDANY